MLAQNATHVFTELYSTHDESSLQHLQPQANNRTQLDTRDHETMAATTVQIYSSMF